MRYEKLSKAGQAPKNLAPKTEEFRKPCPCCCHSLGSPFHSPALLLVPFVVVVVSERPCQRRAERKQLTQRTSEGKWGQKREKAEGNTTAG